LLTWIASPNPKAERQAALARELALSASSESDERAGDHESCFVQTVVMVKTNPGICDTMEFDFSMTLRSKNGSQMKNLV
jgi:hypothetical protein